MSPATSRAIRRTAVLLPVPPAEAFTVALLDSPGSHCASSIVPSCGVEVLRQKTRFASIVAQAERCTVDVSGVFGT